MFWIFFFRTLAVNSVSDFLLFCLKSAKEKFYNTVNRQTSGGKVGGGGGTPVQEEEGGEENGNGEE